MNSTLSSSFNTMTEVPLSKAPNPQLLPGRPTAPGVCSLLTAVCVHLDGLNAEDQFRVWVTTILDNTSHIFYFFIIQLSLNSVCAIKSMISLEIMCPWSTKAVISNTGIFVAIDNNTLYESKLYIFHLCQKSLEY